MTLYMQAVLLFSLNLTDALLTVFWVRNGYASEGNRLMATLLEMGDLPFLGVKIAVGIVAAVAFCSWGRFKLARYGLSLSLILYVGVMAVHFLTGLSAAGLISDSFVHEITEWSRSVIITAF